MEYAKDPIASGIIEGESPVYEYATRQELILYKGRIFLKANTKVRRRIMKEHHDNPLSGHPKFYKTYKQSKE